VTNKKTPAKKAPARKTAAKKATAKKPAAKKPAAKTTAAKKASATKAAVKKPAVKKPAAKKPAAKKPAAKKPAAKTAAAKKAAAAKAAAAEAAPAKKATPAKSAARKPAGRKGAKEPDGKKAPGRRAKKIESPFSVGDYVVYPHHGAATIIKREKISFAGEKQEYFVLEIATDQLTVRVPVGKAVDLGVRPVISQNKARQVFRTFKDEPQEAGKNWSRWYKLLTEKINSGDIFQVAEVVRDLTYAQQVKGISPALKRMLAKARLIIISELRFALDLDEEEAVKRLDRALPKVEIPEEV
jgi:CarD family transcriptional regulator